MLLSGHGNPAGTDTFQFVQIPNKTWLRLKQELQKLSIFLLTFLVPHVKFKVFLKILENLKTHLSSAEGILRESTWWIFRVAGILSICHL